MFIRVCAYMYVYQINSEEGVGYPGARGISSLCVAKCGCWELNFGPL